MPTDDTGRPADTIEDLRAEFPAWEITVRTIEAASGPGGAVYTAQDSTGADLRALTVTGLRDRIIHTELARPDSELPKRASRRRGARGGRQ